jgi:Major capsid protein 13-like
MALSDLTVYSEFTYKTFTELVAQEVEKFNAASQGAITLSQEDIIGDFSDSVGWKKVAGLVRRRNAYGSGAVTAVKLQNIIDTMVKVAAGTPPVELNPSQFKWIQMNPEEAGVILGQQLAQDMVADMLNTGLLAGYSAMIQNTNILYNATGDSPATLTHSAMNKARAKLGDRAQDIACWVTHSLPYYNLLSNNLTNTQVLFNYGTVAVNADPLGRPFVITDSNSLIDFVPNPDTYHVLGLVSGAINVRQNSDFIDNYTTLNGNDNIARTYQAEWSYNVGVKGYAWDKTNGGKSPNDAALAVSTNWDKYATSDKDGPGVILKVAFA